MRDRSFGRTCVAFAIAVVAVAPTMSRVAAQSRPLDVRAVHAWAGLLRAHDERSADTAAIDAALHSTLAPLRAAAARVVGLNRVASRYGMLRAMLRLESDSAAASDAAFALGLAADSSSCAALREALGRPATAVAAAWALGELDARCGPFSALLDGARSAVVRAAMLRVSVKWTPFPDSAVAAAYAKATASGERWSALYAFARTRRAAGGPFALAASSDRDAGIREVAARLLAAGIQPESIATASAARLDGLLQDTSPHVRVAAIRSFASWKAAALAPLQRAWPLERDANVRATMAQSLGAVASDTSALWSAWWASDTTHMVRRSLISSAWQADAIAALRSAAGDSLALNGDFRIRIAMIDGAASKAVDQHAREIADRLGDTDPRVRSAAVAALATASANSREAIGWSALRDAAMHDTDVGVRSAALNTLVRSATPSDVPVALDGYERAIRDTSSDAREAALMVIAAAWRRDSSGFADSLQARLQRLAAPADPLMRARVVSVTPLAHWATAVSAEMPPLSEYERIVRTIVAPALAGRPPFLVIATARGPIRIVLDGVRAPMTADHLSRLARAGYFRNLRFHRVVPAFVAQGGDPRGDGSGGPGYAIRDELNRNAYVRGAVGMALSGPDTGGSQFFLTLAPQPHLNGHYTVFGRVIAGLAAMDALTQGDAMLNISAVPQ